MRTLLLLFAGLLSLSPWPTLAENRLYGIGIQYRPQGLTLSLQLSHPVDPAQVGAFQLLDPAQLVLDLPKTTPADMLPRALAGSGLLKRV
ncbi:type IV pilus secretin PilQ, partial [Herbaspirillum frisingense]